ncbi:MAG: hypothetical protein IJP13_04525 [Lachnospiraceae bacterium]|nr:hypothetical protein [Lachnospiraceae bacterium]
MVYSEYLTKALSCVIISRQALSNYKMLRIKDMKNKAAYNVQQAIEYILKYEIYNNSSYDEEKSIVQIYTHDIEKLIKKYCQPYGVYVPKKIILNSKLYSSWEAESRYSLSCSVRIDSIITALNEIEKWLIKIKPRYKSNINRAKSKLNL